MAENLVQIIEDTLLTARNVIEGEYLNDLPEGIEPADQAGPLAWRIMEVVVNLAERLTDLAGVDPDTLWVPEGAVADAFEPPSSR